MPIFRKENYNILYIHIPKTGGSSVESLFKQSGFELSLIDTGGPGSQNNLRKCSPQHYHFEMLANFLDLNKFDFIFSTVRNPITRLKSEFLMRNKLGSIDPNEWVRHTLDRYRDNPFIYDNHIRPQTTFVDDNVKVFKQEEGFNATWVEQLEAIIPFKLYKGTTRDLNRKSLDGVSTSDVNFSDTTLRTLASFYKDDFIRFGY